jgi:hypothetical protein
MPEKHGPKGVTELSVVPLLPGSGRPPAPDDLTKPEADTWRSVVDAMPLRWFGREQYDLLRGYCAHAVMQNELIARWRLNGYSEELGKMLERETASVIKLARQLRLTKMTRQHAHRDEPSIRNTPKKRLWEK